MTLYFLSYKPKDSFSNTKINHKIFGRIAIINRNGKKTRYYMSGLFHNTKFNRVINGKYYIITENENLINKIEEIVKKYSKEYTLKKDNSIINETKFQTGKEYWSEFALFKGYKIKKWEKEDQSQK